MAEPVGVRLDGPVQIRVAAAPDAGEEDEDGCFCSTPLGDGSCSEDDSGRADGAGEKSSENEGEDSAPSWKPLEQDLILKLVTQIEYYFSDENLAKDAFLLKHIRRNKMGYVSVKLLTSFKKVKQLTRDWRTTAYALKFSDCLELNEDSRKVRRNSPVPMFPCENLPSRMLLVYDFSAIPDGCSLDKEQENGGVQEKVMEHLVKAFVRFGAITSVRILKPGRGLPPEIKRFSSRYSQVGMEECAIVEYEEVEAAIRAHDSFCVADDAPMKVVLIGTKPPKKKVLKDKARHGGSSKGLSKTRSMNKRVEELQDAGDELSATSSSDQESDTTSPTPGRRSTSFHRLRPSTYANPHHLSPNVSPRSSPWSSPSALHKTSQMSPLVEDSRGVLSTSPEMSSRKGADYSSDSSITPSSSPWVRRRWMQEQTLTQEKSPGGSPGSSPKMHHTIRLPVGVLRLPRGPDGTKGFHNSHERNKAFGKK